MDYQKLNSTVEDETIDHGVNSSNDLRETRVKSENSKPTHLNTTEDCSHIKLTNR